MTAFGGLGPEERGSFSSQTSRTQQRPIQLILMRQLAVHLTMPVFIVDDQGALLFYNEPAEQLLGRSYEDNDEVPLEDWSLSFRTTSEDGQAVPASELPLVRALKEGRPSYLGPLLIVGRDEVQRRIAIVAFPLQGLQKRPAGAVAMFWEL